MGSDVDRRAVLAGSLAGGLPMLLTIVAGLDRLTTTYLLTVLAVAPLVSGIPAGICVGWLDRTYHGGMNSGGLAAIGGTLLGLFGFATMRALTLPGLSLGERLDVVFVMAAVSLLPLMAVFPFIFFAGGLVATRVAAGRQPTDDFELYDLPSSEE